MLTVEHAEVTSALTEDFPAVSHSALQMSAAISRFNYDSSSGVFTYKVATSKSRIGQVAGSCTAGGYLEVTLLRKRIHLHRLAWLVYYGELPASGVHIDHIDGNRKNNAIANLRLATASENGQNRKRVNSNSASGVPGVHWYKAYKKWSAEVMVNRVKIHLGYFNTIEEATYARRTATEKLHPRTSTCLR